MYMNVLEQVRSYHEKLNDPKYMIQFDPKYDIKLNIDELVGDGYKAFWHSKERYRVMKGSRASKKSKTIALWYIYHMMKYPQANTVVVRKRLNTHRTSTRNDLIWAINRLNVKGDWQYSTSDTGELTITRKSTGQKIFFRGFDDPLNITSFSVNVGILCWCWFEEAFQINSEADFSKVDMSIRGALSDGSSLESVGLWKQITFSFNSWSDKHWLKSRFFDRCPSTDITTEELDEFDKGKRNKINKYARNSKENILVGTTIYACNEFLDKDDKALFDWKRVHQPTAFNVEGLGNWGVSEGLVFDNWEVQEFDYKEIVKRSVNINGRTHLKMKYGLDFGYTNDNAALSCSIVDEENMIIWIYDEFYRLGQTNMMLADIIKRKGLIKEEIRCDSAEPKSIDELKYFGVRRAVQATKGKGSVAQGIGRLKDYKIIVHPKCTEHIVEFNNYVWARDKNTDKALNVPVDEFNHLMDALRYATEGIRQRSFRF